MLETVLSSVIGQLEWRWVLSSPHSLNRIETFTDAGRGSWGSLTFLLSHFRPSLAMFGAIITVLSTVISIFSQQALQTVSCQRPTLQGRASVPIAQTLVGLEGMQPIHAKSNINYYQPGIDLLSAPIAGLAGSSSPSCTSGNCTFQATNGITYSSTGLSSECIDVSSLIRQSGLLSWDEQDEIDGDGFTMYSLPNGLNFSYVVHKEWSYLTRWGWGSRSLLRRMPWLRFGMALRQKGVIESTFDTSILLMQTMSPCRDPSKYQAYLTGDDANPMPPVNTSCEQLNLPGVTTLPGLFSVVAAACFIYPSIQHYAGSVADGTLAEQRVGDPIPLRRPTERFEVLKDEYPNGLSYYRFSDPCIVDNVVYTDTSSNLSSLSGGLITMGNATAPKRCYYGFNGYWTFTVFGGTYGMSNCEPSQTHTTILCPFLWWLGNLYNKGNATVESIDRFFDAGFKGFTDQLRTHGMDWDNITLVASGTVLGNTVCTEFHWVWLIYPLVMLIGTLILFIATVLSSSGMFGYSSVLPLLFYGLEAQHQRDGLQLSSAKELNTVAKELKVDFSARDGEWKLHAVGNGDTT
ncbi:hypothetical protein PG994_005039 [Apiospora phragmitis]|uniref:Uncharacterized protein n=1 Tax=Apiospora phragmitis TaxID=2905665 RepID=A0ABR1VSA4_9PEZI